MPLLSKDHYRVGRSKTGLGLFAVKPIKKGAKIIRYFGPLLDARNKKHDGIENKYLFELNKRWTIDGSVRKNIARYINHACKPNAESDVNPSKKRVIIRAIKNIEPGEEINYDYGTDYFKAYLKPIGCKCASCEKKRKKKAAEARAEKAKLKLKAERKAQAEADKAARKAAKASGKATKDKASKPDKVATSKAPEGAKAKTAATTKGTSKAAKTKVVTAKAGKTKAAKSAKTTSSRKTSASKSKSKSKAA
ncbi:SET domain-containing protein-lysine N-methyltransferase [Rhodopseudomonas palustris]|uniref:SET domain-containing protein-lysine N-methyltransferase n=1 Tax=Rhodopseudomonas palustris TaxID=1076 RepID=A0A323UAI3_RHOPL|nr:SET domain-containing protein [Rhodopseudomonas palustris]PZA09239.1 SET domain-containing protein-lysine N-methyltransferase [Rhodopseudomonas palustris]